jgi:hypothetical protein
MTIRNEQIITNSGMIHGLVVKWNNTTSVKITAGLMEINGKHLVLAADTTHSLTGLTAPFQFHYIYVNYATSTYPSTPVFFNNNFTPSWSASKQGWYDVNNRCIGALAISGSVIQFFEAIAISDHLIRNSIDHYNIASGMNPSGAWQTPNVSESSVYVPINAVEISVNLECLHTANVVSASFSSSEAAAIKTSIYDPYTKARGYNNINYADWGPLGASRNIKIGGESSDTFLSAWVNGYGYSR